MERKVSIDRLQLRFRGAQPAALQPREVAAAIAKQLLGTRELRDKKGYVEIKEVNTGHVDGASNNVSESIANRAAEEILRKVR